MLSEKIKKRPLSGKFLLFKNNVEERPKLDLLNSNKLNVIKELKDKFNKNEDKVETKLNTKTFAETKENNTNSSINQITDKTEFLEMLSKQKESDKEALDNIIVNEVNRIKNVNEKKKKLNDINLIEKNYDDLYIWQNLFNHSRPLSNYTTLKRRKIKKLEENKDLEEFKSPVILVDLYEDQMNLYFGKNNLIQTEGTKNKIRSAREKYDLNNNKLINNRAKKSNHLSINTNLNLNNNVILPINNIKQKTQSKNQSSAIYSIKSKKSSSARNRIMSSINSRKSQKNRDKSLHKHIRPMSVYSPRAKTCSFYFSNTFSDYYKEDLKTFSEKMKILKAKVKSNPNHLKREIKTQRIVSHKKEKKLEDIINSNKITFDKEDLITAADRRNPIPLLKSIFKTNYPDKEVMKENIKMYYNTMKPLGNSRESIDYTQNERWGFVEKFSEMRGGVKKEIHKKEIRNNKNLILKYYDEDDPHIKMFEKMVRNKTAKIKDLKYLKEEEDLSKKKYFNPILNNIEETVPFLKEKEDKKTEDKKTQEEINKENIENPIDAEVRPKTGFKSVASHIDTTFNFNFNTNKNIKRPQTSNIKEISMIDNNYYVPYSNLEYKSKVSFPIKTSSNVGNVSYDKINQMLQERQFGLSKIKNDYFITSTGQVKNKEKKQKYKEEKIILPNYKKSKKIYDFGEISDFGFNFGFEKGNTPREKKVWAEEYFKNFRRKHYSSSNNVHIKNKRKNKVELLNKYYTQSQYSNDDPEIELIDKSVSSQTNSLNRKI